MARAGRFSPELVKEWIDRLAAQPCYLSLTSGDPFAVSDPTVLEPGGPGYVRIRVVWLRSGNLLRNRDAMTFLGLPAGTTVQAIVGFSSATGGGTLFSIPVPRVDYDKDGYFDLDAEGILVGV